MFVCLFLSVGIGTMAFDTRLGLYSDPPSPEGLKFIAAVHDFFDLSQKLLLSIPSNLMRPYMDTPALKKFFLRWQMKSWTLVRSSLTGR